ncbi:MAG: hypothetical protein AAF191_13130 [Verrucomicrobiota bacterium]
MKNHTLPFLTFLLLITLGTATGQKTLNTLSIGDYPGIRSSTRVNPGISSGSHSGFYIRFAEDISALCEKYGTTAGDSSTRYKKYPKFRLNVMATNGGFDSVKRLRFESETQLAIVQSDLWYFADRNSNPSDPYGQRLSPEKRASWAKMADCIRLVLPLYTEKIHIVVRKEEKGESGDQFKDLMSLFEKNARVNIGTVGSGSMITCTLIEEMILEEMRRQGKRDMRWKPSFDSAGIALGRLVDKNVDPDLKLDAVIFVGGVPYPALDKFSLTQVKEKAKRSIFSLGNLGGGGGAPDNSISDLALLPFGEEADRIVDRNPRFRYVKTAFSQDDYPFLAKSNERVWTRGVTACLVTHRDYTTQSKDSHKILWVRHILYRILTKLDPGSKFGLADDFGEPQAGDKWLALFENRDQTGKMDWDSFGWKRHDDPVLQSMLNIWSTGSRPVTPGRIIDPDVF